MRLLLSYATFDEVTDCASVLDATNSFPAIATCYFSINEARLTLQTRLERDTEYSLTITLNMPADEYPDAQGNKNSFHMFVSAVVNDTRL